MKPTVHLGYEVGAGRPVEIPVGHIVVTGQTQLSGKTTTLEALIARSGLRAVTFITKRGEGSFQDGRRLAPFFRERADWVFVSSLIDATMGEKNKLLRAWLMKVCRNTRTLAEVQANVKAAQAQARGFSESIYTEIDGYLDLVVPQLRQLPPARRVEIGPGLNVMDLSPYSTELQALVIRSVLEHVYEHESEVVTVIPEAWEFLPEGRGSPVKREAETLIRKGGVLRNFMWLDSQDLAGLWKIAVRACPVFLIGVQREANEIKRTLANIPAGTAKPSAADIATLELGQFYACWGRHSIKTYVRPDWMNAEDAKVVAVGSANADRILAFGPKRREATVTEKEARALKEENERLTREVNELKRQLKGLEARPVEGVSPSANPTSAGNGAASLTYEQIKARLLSELPQEPALLRLVTQRPELQVKVERVTIESDMGSIRGRVAALIAKGFFQEPKTGNAVCAEIMGKQAFKSARPSIYAECDKLTAMGFFVKGKDGYQAVAGMKVHILEG